jgi:23S rRNA (adenine-N6)-dimethyltransferase
MTVPSHSQNFFRSSVLVDRLLDASDIRSTDLVLDLGAGSGVIAACLARRGCQVVAVEQDACLAERLRLRFAEVPNVRVRHADILRMYLPNRPYKVFSNIPFDATSAIVSRLTHAALEAEAEAEDLYLVVQREAAERFIGAPWTTLQAVLLFPWFEASIVHTFRRTDFTPVPRVDVVMLRLRKRGPPLLTSIDAQLYRDFVICLFSGNSLRLLVGKRRAERLTRAVDIIDASPMRIPAPRWLQLFRAALGAGRDELRWSVPHAEQHLRQTQRRLHKLHRTSARRLRPPPRSVTRERGSSKPNQSDRRLSCQRQPICRSPSRCATRCEEKLVRDVL